MGTPEFATPTLERLIHDRHEIAAVFTQPDKPSGRGKKLQPPPVKLLALSHGIPVYQPAKIRTNEEVRAVFESIRPDACVVAAYGKILPEWMLAIPRFGCINVHASLLPKYRGAAPINWAIASGERETGVTIMQMDVGLDTGPMLAARALEIGPEEIAPTLSARLALLGRELLAETLPAIEAGKISPVAQDESAATYAPMLKREDGLIDWQMSATQIANRVRAFQPWPGTYTRFRGGRLILWRAHPIETAPLLETARLSGARLAQLIDIDKSGIVVACGEDSALRIEELQVEGKRRVAGRDFANGFRLVAGDRIID